MRTERRSAGVKSHIPLLHLAGRNVNALSLATTAHGEVNIKGGKTLAQVALGDDIERSGVIKDVVVESEVTAGKYLALNLTMTRNAG